jgi:hypothetical protein
MRTAYTLKIKHYATLLIIIGAASTPFTVVPAPYNNNIFFFLGVVSSLTLFVIILGTIITYWDCSWKYTMNEIKRGFKK